MKSALWMCFTVSNAFIRTRMLGLLVRWVFWRALSLVVFLVRPWMRFFLSMLYIMEFNFVWIGLYLLSMPTQIYHFVHELVHEPPYQYMNHPISDSTVQFDKKKRFSFKSWFYMTCNFGQYGPYGLIQLKKRFGLDSRFFMTCNFPIMFFLYHYHLLFLVISLPPIITCNFKGPLCLLFSVLSLSLSDDVLLLSSPPPLHLLYYLTY